MIPQKATLAATLALLLTASAGLGAAAFAGLIPSPLATQAFADDAQPEDAEALEVFEGELPANVTEGILDLRTFRGNVLVEAWDEPAYKIAVYRFGDEPQQFGDAEITITFDDGMEDGALRLALEVAEEGVASVRANGGERAEYAVVAQVPELHWREALVCSGGVAGSGFRTSISHIPGMDGEEGACNGSEAPIRSTLQPSSDERQSDVPFAVRGLSGGELTVLAEYASLRFENATFETARVATEYGSVTGSLDASTLVAESEYGSIDLETAADDITAHTEYGAVRIAVTETAGGTFDLTSEYGKVVLAVPEGPGYDVSAATEYGKVRVLLGDLESEDEEKEDDSGATADLAARFVDNPPNAQDRRYGDSFDGRTEGYEDAAVQVTIDLETEYGNILLTSMMKDASEDRHEN